jgi:hypothetical protein
VPPAPAPALSDSDKIVANLKKIMGTDKAKEMIVVSDFLKTVQATLHGNSAN